MNSTLLGLGIGWCGRDRREVEVGGRLKSHERPRFQSTAKEIFLRRELRVAERRARMATTVIKIFIEPKTKVTAKNKRTNGIKRLP